MLSPQSYQDLLKEAAAAGYGPTNHQRTSFKVVLVGDKGVGKSTFIKRPILQGLNLQSLQYPHTLITLRTNVGAFKFTLQTSETQDCESGGLTNLFYKGADAAIIMFDVTSRTSYKNIPNWYKQVCDACDGIPIVLLGNKVDCKDRLVKPKNIVFHRKKNLPYYDVSAKSNYQFEKPLLFILRKLTGNPSLLLIEQVALHAPELNMESEFIKCLEYERVQSEEAQLPDEDDE